MAAAPLRRLDRQSVARRSIDSRMRKFVRHGDLSPSARHLSKTQVCALFIPHTFAPPQCALTLDPDSGFSYIHSNLPSSISIGSPCVDRAHACIERVDRSCSAAVSGLRSRVHQNPSTHVRGQLPRGVEISEQLTAAIEGRGPRDRRSTFRIPRYTYMWCPAPSLELSSIVNQDGCMHYSSCCHASHRDPRALTIDRSSPYS